VSGDPAHLRDKRRPGGGAIETGLTAMAAGRLVLGAMGRLAPNRAGQSFGIGAEMSPELAYMTRVFGIRAIALGAGYLLSEGEPRRLWQRLAFMCDISDTIAGARSLYRGDVPRGSALALTAMTGTYAAIGAARIAQDSA
jgi:hypothetical protein